MNNSSFKMKYRLLFLLFMHPAVMIIAQENSFWRSLPSLPDNEGFAGMFAGVSNDKLFCMGGANFPGKRPWEGGEKKWYTHIYMLDNEKEWIKLQDTLPLPLAYGVSISHNNIIYLIGGSSNNKHINQVMSFCWKSGKLNKEHLPPLPVPLANMTGAIIKDLMLIAGGAQGPQEPPLHSCYALDLKNSKNGWFQMPAWPGPVRNLPVSASYDGAFYLFSGEKTGMNAENEVYRHILQDAYRFIPEKKGRQWTGSWQTLAPLPLGASAAGTTVPVLKNGSMLIAGGVDAITALHTNPVTHPGISSVIQIYYPKHNAWQIFHGDSLHMPRVTLPVIKWKDHWVYISGEVKPGIRTNTVVALKE